MFESRVYKTARLTFSFLWNCTLGLVGATSRIRSATVRNLAVTVLLGCVFAFASGPTLTTIYSFGANPDDGIDPLTGVVFDKAGNLYGAAAVGGAKGSGMVFELSPPASRGNPWTETAPRQLRRSPGGTFPECRLIVASTGELFGTTLEGGANNMGAVFELLPPAPGGLWKERVIYSFGSFAGDAANPNSGLLAGKNAFFGATGGGANFTGAVFQLTPPTVRGRPWTETVLYSFAGFGSTDAAFPSGELIMDKKGNLYGTSLLGGANNVGTVFEVSPPAVAGAPWTETILYSFSGPDGSSPAGRLLLDASGNLFGTTDGGGAGQSGTVFQLAPPPAPGAPWTQTVLYSFSGGEDGSSPSAGMVMDKTGRLFGTAKSGGAGGPRGFGGVVFELDPPAMQGGTWTETVLYSFGGPDGFLPGSLLTLKNGKLYGTTSEGGDFGTGTVFALKP